MEKQFRTRKRFEYAFDRCMKGTEKENRSSGRCWIAKTTKKIIVDWYFSGNWVHRGMKSMSEHDWKVHIPARQKSMTDKQEVIRVFPEAYNALVEIYNESTLSIKELASI